MSHPDGRARTPLRAAHQARQKCRAERRALEDRGNFAAIRTGTDYERFVANVLGAANIPTFRVGGSGDYGADLLAETSTGPAVIQCKFYTHPVGYDAVQQAYTAKALYKTTAAYVVTNATYTPQARRVRLYRLASQARLRLGLCPPPRRDADKPC